VSAVSGTKWRQVPVGPDAARWITRTGCKTVLVIVHTVTMGQRLTKLLPLFETDQRVQVVFTAGPHAFGNGVARLLRRLDGVVIPWQQAIETPFDLALAAGYPSVHEVRAPLIVVPHGAAYNKLVVRSGVGGTVAARGVYGLDQQHLVQGGRVVPDALVLSHRADLAVLGRQCPEAVPVAEVVGDPCYDELAVSRPLRAVYRKALGVAEEKRLVVTASTWGTGSLFGRLTDLHDRMLAELPSSQYEMVALLHTNVWYGQGPRQIRAWLSTARRRGLVLLPPESEWLSALLAADVVIGDAGSTSVYAAAAGVPVIIGTFATEDIAPGSAAALLADGGPRLRFDRPFAQQLADAIAHHRPELSESVAARITSEPGQFRRNMRRLIYRRLGLTQPASIPVTPPARLPWVIRQPTTVNRPQEQRWRAS
jgi:hypothetical protein